MGSITYDFLANSMLFHEGHLENDYHYISHKELENVLADYREHCLKNATVLTEEVKNYKSSLKVLSSLEKNNFELLVQGIIDTAVAVGGLIGTVQTAGWSLLASALAATSGYKSYKEYKSGIKENPSYLLWKVIKK